MKDHIPYRSASSCLFVFHFEEVETTATAEKREDNDER